MATTRETTNCPVTTLPATADEAAKAAKTKRAADLHTARVMTDGSINAVVVQKYLPGVNDGGDMMTLAEVTREQVKAIAGGDLSMLEGMLLSQATALQAMFFDLAIRAKMQDRFDGIQTMTTLALKCAAQSRQAIVALAELRMPKSVMFAKQANVSGGHQQINNGVAALASPARAEELQDRPNELSGADHELLEDTRTSGAAGGADSHLAAVGTSHRAEVIGR